jgi:LmbE family N-acetylglucosaminyl deacetylase
VNRILCIGAHPDDCEGSVGGTALLLRRSGRQVKFVSATDGARGHFAPEYLQNPALLIERRLREAVEAARIADVEFETLGIQDGDVYVNLESTEAMIRLIRLARPDLVLCNRPCDYHRDHRYTAQLVIDASYMLTVPFVCPDVPALEKMPTFAYWQDGFTESGSFRADACVPIDSVIETKLEMMLAHESQYLEWLPYNADPAGYTGPLSRDTVRPNLMRRSRRTAERFADLLPAGTQFAEAYQICEYGTVPSKEEFAAFFASVTTVNRAQS